MTGSLRGRAILVTRPIDQASELCRLIEAEGGQAVAVPMQLIEPVPAEMGADVETADWLIFVSLNAVRHGAKRVLTIPAERRPRIAAIGEGTARALVDVGLQVDLVPKPQFNSEGLLATPAMQAVRGARIGVIRGRGGRELLGDELAQRGARVSYMEVYRRVANPDARQVARLWREGRIEAATVTSGEALQQLYAALGSEAPDAIGRLPLAVFGDRLAARARESGWRRVEPSTAASDPALLAAVKQFFPS